MKIILYLSLIILSINSLLFGLEKVDYKNEINKLVGIDFQNKFVIIKIIEVNNILAVFLNPPYREFPNIILFRLGNNKYQRIIESLSVGIIDKRSEFLDLHTIKHGMDLRIANQETYSFKSPKEKQLIQITLNKNNAINFYTNFIHIHVINGTEGAYTIDKTSFYNIAVKLFGKDYWDRYPKNTCTMYDLPKILDADMKFNNDKYIITANTDNKQKWMITFSGVDEDNMFLLNKEINAE